MAKLLISKGFNREKWTREGPGTSVQRKANRRLTLAFPSWRKSLLRVLHNTTALLWYADDGRHLLRRWVSVAETSKFGENGQRFSAFRWLALWVQTVGSALRDRYRLGHRAVSSGSWLNVQSGHHNPVLGSSAEDPRHTVSGAHVIGAAEKAFLRSVRLLMCDGHRTNKERTDRMIMARPLVWPCLRQKRKQVGHISVVHDL